MDNQVDRTVFLLFGYVINFRFKCVHVRFLVPSLFGAGHHFKTQFKLNQRGFQLFIHIPVALELCLAARILSSDV